MIPPDPEEPRRTPSTKDRRRWCKGKVGRPHKPQIAIPPNAPTDLCGWVERINRFTTEPEYWYRCHHVELCAECGKVLRQRHYYWLKEPTNNHLRVSDCPEWTSDPKPKWHYPNR